MTRRSWTLVLMVVLGMTLFTALNAAAQAPAHKVVGAEKCKMCHQGPAKGNQFQIWTASNHAKAYATLATPEALEAGKKLGIAEPQKDEKCLSCHATANFLKAPADVSYKVEEGVGCEACHGPGSDYKAMAVMKDRAKAVAAGMVVPDEKTCLQCHNEKSPTYKPFNFAEMSKKIAHPAPKAEAAK